MRKINKCMRHVMDTDAVGGGSRITAPAAGDICYADPGNLKSFSSSLTALKDEIEQSINDMYGTINGMGGTGAWDGTVYAQFCAKCNSFRGSLQGYADIVGVFADQVTTLASATNDLIAEIKSSCS